MSVRTIRPQPVVVAAIVAASSVASAQFNLTLFHHSDAESAIVNAPAQPEYGGVARFKSKLDQLRAAAGANVLTVSNGDMFLAGPQLDATLSNPSAPFYDALAQDLIGYNAFGLGNHEFDFGPSVTRRYIDQFGGSPTFLSANLDFSGEPQLSPLINTRLFKSTVVNVGGEQVGIVGATTPLLPTISSPGGVVANPVLAAVQAEVDRLRNVVGVNKIVLASHLQSISEELSLIPQLRGVDVVLAGGGEELMANPGVALVPGDSRPSSLSGVPNQYPLLRTDADGNTVALVSTAGKYKYVGQLNVTFDAQGNVTAASGDPVRVASTTVDPANGVAPDATVQAQVVAPVQAHIGVLQSAKIARTEVDLEGRRSGPNGTGIRRTETNLGNLMADSIRWQTARSADEASLGRTGPIVGFQNGGGIRNDSLIAAATDPAPAKNLSRFDAFSIAAFNNFASLAQDVSPQKLKEILEHSVANVGGGQFGHWSGLRFSYDPRLPAGQRIVDVVLESAGAGDADLLIIDEGQVVPGSPAIDLATIDFLTFGGDGYPLTDLQFTRFGVSYTQALENFITASPTSVFGGLAGLDGLINATNYPFTPLDNPLAFDSFRRIDAVPEPTAAGAMAVGAALLARRRRRGGW